jgi:hypothetical protein
MRFQMESLTDILWGALSLLGVLAATGILALAFRFGEGQW